MLGPYERFKNPAQPATLCSRFIFYTIGAAGAQGEYRESYLIGTDLKTGPPRSRPGVNQTWVEWERDEHALW
jgi:hypothetical protein